MDFSRTVILAHARVTLGVVRRARQTVALIRSDEGTAAVWALPGVTILRFFPFPESL
jgi:hypothetical protein